MNHRHKTPDPNGPPPSDSFLHPDTPTCEVCGGQSDTVKPNPLFISLCEECTDEDMNQNPDLYKEDV